ncbi:restriction endonuclease, partial [Arthrobacter rhombi]|uniref:restriction endonuclease n=1 Tax=Arthrobacter rhombi TaxID=71253 RepID=UPI003FD24591
WQTEHVSRTALKDDLLNTVNGALPVFSPSRNNAVARLGEVASKGQDSIVNGSAGNNGRPANPPTQSARVDEPSEELIDPLTLPTFEAIRDRIRNHIVENFTGHKLTHLVAGILHARGFVCHVSPEDADGGIDILAGTGPLGLDDPTLAVEVKSEIGTIGATVVRGLQCAMTAHSAKQGLVVAWGGFKPSARSELYQKRTMIRFWDAEDILDQIFEVYLKLSSEAQTGCRSNRFGFSTRKQAKNARGSTPASDTTRHP